MLKLFVGAQNKILPYKLMSARKLHYPRGLSKNCLKESFHKNIHKISIIFLLI